MSSTPALPQGDRARVTEILKALVAIESVNPSLPGGSGGEAAVADYVADFCEGIGLPVEQSEALPGRPNVLARLCTPHSPAVLLLEAHTDTVTLANMPDGLTPRVVGSRLHGRGACDTKGGLAAALHALELLAAVPRLRRAEVQLLGAIDEEVAYRGVLHHLAQGHVADAAIVIEPTSLAPVIATKGCLRVRLRTRGRSAHTSEPQLGRNAIVAMVATVGALEHWMQGRTDTHPRCGPPTLTVSRIGGGTQINIVPDDCWIEVDYRTLPTEDPDDVLAALAALLEEQAPAARIDEVLITDRGLDTSPDAAIARVAAAACAEVAGADALIGVPYGSDASKLSALAGIPSIVLGPGDIAQAHADDEWVDLDEVVAAAEIYLRCAVGLAEPG